MKHHISALEVFIKCCISLAFYFPRINNDARSNSLQVSLPVHSVIFDMICSVLGCQQGNCLHNMSIYE